MCIRDRGHSIAHTGHVHIHDPVRDIHDHTHIIRAQQLIELDVYKRQELACASDTGVLFRIPVRIKAAATATTRTMTAAS